jgi:uroporphyrin-III C-methyltransferase
MSENGTPQTTERPAAPARSSRRPGKAAAAFAILAVLLAWQWLDTRGRLESLREQVAQRVRDSEFDSRDARILARQAQESLRDVQAKQSQLEIKLAESQSQQVALEALYQELSRSRDEWVLAEIEQILTIASQQLQLAGNVRAALVALQTADARLARSDRPQFAPLRKVIASDIDRLKAAPTPDIPGLAIKLDQLIVAVDSLPLAQESRPAIRVEESAENSVGGLWQRLGADVLNELKQLVRVEHMERPDPAMLAPSQAFFLRENLKLRLLNARLALLARDESTYRADLKTASAWVDRYFDRAAPSTASLRGTLSQLGAGASSMALPAMSESLAAVRNYKTTTRDRATR